MHDASGIETPSGYLWINQNGIYYPVVKKSLLFTFK